MNGAGPALALLPARPAAASGGRTVERLTALSLVLLFTLSPMVLYQAGLRYEAPGGSALEKVHPGTFVAAAALGLRAIRAPGAALGLLVRHSGLPVFLAAWTLLLAHILLVQGVPFTPIIDTFLLPLILFALLVDRRGPAARPLALGLHALMTANAALGLAEMLTGWRLTPYVAGTVQIGDDWRATALLGHPLANACLTGSYALILAAGGGRDLPAIMRGPLIGFQLAAMVAFGGRASLVTALLLLGLLAGRQALAIAAGRPLRLAHVAAAAVAAPLLAAALAVLAEAGFFDRLIDRFGDDRGSARTRVVMFDLFRSIPARDILLGPDQELVATLRNLEGLEFGIESLWVSFALTYGLAASALFFVGLALFCRDLMRAARPGAGLALLFFFVVASTSVSLAAKSPIFGMFVALVLVLLRKETPDGAERQEARP